MKKAIITILIVVLCLAMNGCNDVDPEDVPEELTTEFYQGCVDAISIADRYLNEKLSSEEAVTQLDEVRDQLMILQNECKDDDLALMSDSVVITMIGNTKAENKKELLDSRNSLAIDLKLEERTE